MNSLWYDLNLKQVVYRYCTRQFYISTKHLNCVWHQCSTVLSEFFHTYLLFTLTQEYQFPDELAALRTQRFIKPSSKVIKLCPVFQKKETSDVMCARVRTEAIRVRTRLFCWEDRTFPNSSSPKSMNDPDTAAPPTLYRYQVKGYGSWVLEPQFDASSIGASHAAANSLARVLNWWRLYLSRESRRCYRRSRIPFCRPTWPW